MTYISKNIIGQADMDISGFEQLASLNTAKYAQALSTKSLQYWPAYNEYFM